MRALTVSQKKLLKKTLEAYNKRTEWGELEIKIYSVEDLPSEIWERLEKTNDTEILWQNVNRFIGDYNSEITYK